ncbi:hypothetical protein OH460_08960 [Vibrio sp. Makdt]|uniref:hypothetical protein n=1 Tax=Vibrio sp. Makdt TaxID=2998828 RepID=UPI0022CD842C|nr:hypothetical protein [Vibrio sp. Makdt]MDA0152431.1 hypothetical protein [Vibrio sp. Makdt]
MQTRNNLDRCGISIDFSFLQPAIDSGSALNLNTSLLRALLSDLKPYRVKDTAKLESWLTGQLQSQSEVDTIHRILTLSSGKSTPITWLRVMEYCEDGFDPSQVGIFHYSALEFMSRPTTHAGSIEQDMVLSIGLVNKMNYQAVVDLFTELKSLFSSMKLTDDIKLRQFVNLLLLSYGIIANYGTPKQLKSCKPLVWPITVQNVDRLVTIAENCIEPLKAKLRLLPCIESTKAKFTRTLHGFKGIVVTPEILLEAAIYKPKSIVKSFGCSLKEQKAAIDHIRSALSDKNKITTVFSDGKKGDFFLSTGGTFCLRSSRTKGFPFEAMEKVISTVEVFEPKDELAYTLFSLNAGMASTSKYVSKACTTEAKFNPIAASCLKANPWLSPSMNGLSTGCSVDGKVVSLNRILKLANPTDAETIRATIANHLSTRLVISISPTREGVFYTILNDGDKEWLCGWTERSKGNRGGKEYTYLLVNKTDFIGYDVD